jgi:uncharacterized protein
MGAAAVAREPDVGSAARAGLCFTVVVAGRKIMEQFPEREEDSWFSEAQMDAVVRADETDRLHSPFPTAMVSNGEYMPFAQTPKQKEVEARLADKADEASHMLGISRRRFLATSGGMAAAFLAMNEVFGRFFDVHPEEMFEPAAAAELGPPRDLFVFDGQLHMIRDNNMRSGRTLRATAQGPGPASTAAGFTHNPYNPMGFPDELGNPWTPWTGSLGQTPNLQTDFQLVQFVKDVFLDSQVTVGHLTNAPLGLFTPPGESEPRRPHMLKELLDVENLTAFQTCAVRDFINAVAGSQRALAHGQIFPGRYNLDYMQQQIDQCGPDSWKGYTSAYCAKDNDDPRLEMTRWRLDDEEIAYPTYEVIKRNRAQLEKRPAFFNIAIHKGLSTLNPDDPAAQNPSLGTPDDIPKAATDWPEFNFIIFHGSWAPQFFGKPSLDAIKAGRTRNGVPDIQWTTQMAQDCARYPNVYTELGSTFGATVTAWPTVCAHLIGQILKYWGTDRLVFGTDSVWYGSPQWQIEAFWRFRMPEELMHKYGYPELTETIKRKVLGVNGAKLFKLKPVAPVARDALYKPVPKNFESMVPDELKKRLADVPGYRGYTELIPDDNLSKLRRDYAEAGGLPANRRYGWIRRG